MWNTGLKLETILFWIKNSGPRYPDNKIMLSCTKQTVQILYLMVNRLNILNLETYPYVKYEIDRVPFSLHIYCRRCRKLTYLTMWHTFQVVIHDLFPGITKGKSHHQWDPRNSHVVNSRRLASVINLLPQANSFLRYLNL